MSSVITIAFENWKAQEAATGKPVLLNEFVFANVPGLDATKPIDRNEKLPPANQIVYRQAVNKTGLASENAVAYSVTLGAEVGDFDFNWIGLLNKESGTIAMITHAPTQKKLKTTNGQQGNVLTRSFLLEFAGAAKETQITTTAETWQIDFTARLSGIDEMQRLINTDSYGAAAFFDDGFEVTRSAEQFTVKKGLAYVGGLRGLLEQNQILNNLRNTKIYADFSYQGNIVSQWRTVIKITAAAALNNYIDAAGFSHQVFAVASIDASGNVKDLRPMGALSDQELSALETRFKLDLSKKIDKANITHQTGTSTEFVVSQQLLTNESGKKFDKTGGTVSGSITSTGNISSQGNIIQLVPPEGNVLQLDGSFSNSPRINSKPKDGSWRNHVLPDKSGVFMQISDWGFGADVIKNTAMDNSDTTSLPDFNNANRTAVYKSDGSNPNAKYFYSPMFNMTRQGGSEGLGFRSQLQIDTSTGKLATRGAFGANWSAWLNPMYAGDYGWGGNGESLTMTEIEMSAYLRSISTGSRVFRNNSASTTMSEQYATVAHFTAGDTFVSLSASHSGTSVNVVAGNRGTLYAHSLYTNRNTVVDRNGNLKRNNFPDELSDYPVGAPIPWPQAAAPSGYLVCNGQSFNKTTYPLLAKAYPSGKIDDLRAEFIRGLDAGRGVDTGRVVLSAQSDMFKAHNHSVIAEDSGSGTAYFGRGNGSRRNITKDAMDLEGGNETRPRNIAYLYIVRAA